MTDETIKYFMEVIISDDLKKAVENAGLGISYLNSDMQLLPKRNWIEAEELKMKIEFVNYMMEILRESKVNNYNYYAEKATELLKNPNFLKNAVKNIIPACIIVMLEYADINLWLDCILSFENFEWVYHIGFANFLSKKIKNSENIKICYYRILPEFVEIEHHKYLHYPEHFEKANKIIRDSNKRYNRIKNTVACIAYIILAIMFAIIIWILSITRIR